MNKLTEDILRRELVFVLSQEQLIDFSYAEKNTVIHLPLFALNSSGIMRLIFSGRESDVQIEKESLALSLDEFSLRYIHPAAQVLAPLKRKNGPIEVGDMIKIDKLGWVTIKDAVARP